MRSDTAKSPASRRGSDCFELVALDLGEVAELADVHAEDRDRRRVHEVDRVQHRPVAAERDHEVEPVGETVGGDAERVEPAHLGLRLRDPHFDAALGEPARRRAREVVRDAAIAMRHEADRACRPAHPAAAVLVAGVRRRDDRVDRRTARPRPSAARVREELDVAVGAAQRRRDERAARRARDASSAGDDLPQHRIVHDGIAHDAALADPRRGPPRTAASRAARTRRRRW